MRKAIAILTACGMLLLAASASAAETTPSEWPGRLGRYVFEITRDGKSIGTQSIEITQSGDTVTAVTESKVAVKMLGVVVYRMHQVLTETYRGGKLVTVRAETKDPDGFRGGEITRNGDRWTGKLGKEHRAFDCDCMASTMWHVASMTGSDMIEASQVRLRSVIVEEKGTKTLDLPEGPVATRHFVVKGDLDREVWFSPHGNLVEAQQVGSDGSLIRQILMSDPAASRETGQEAGEP
jgi:hypothetical protein